MFQSVNILENPFRYQILFIDPDLRISREVDKKGTEGSVAGSPDEQRGHFVGPFLSFKCLSAGSRFRRCLGKCIYIRMLGEDFELEGNDD
ncbi:hypothetical protein GWI33_020007 [Rhynchophorus ferrugineus]|uniref:Uncharacterized protein n=1 Tax=Rhynchophorus ferrugineus TaxID=354439 RepID=A0A834HQ93_RHYFE|nr:hypothetical protein GWI33_020007 [Rhynchophorus ferrugineus]